MAIVPNILFFYNSGFLLGIGVVVAQQTLTLLVQVRFLYPLPYKNTLSHKPVGENCCYAF